MNADRKARIAIRLTFLVVAAVALALVCRQGSSLFAVGLVFVVYVTAATLWVRGQYQASVDAARAGDDNLLPWTFPYWISIPAAVIGAVLIIVGVKDDTSSLLLAGALLAYLSLGYILMRFRNKGITKWRLGVGGAALIVSALLLVLGLITLESHDRAVWAVVLGFLMAPVGLSVLAAPTLRWLQYAGRGVWVAGIAGLGTLLLVADAAVAIARVDTRWMVLVFVAIALLVLAIVSSTQADIAVVIAAFTLMGVTSMSEEKPKALDPEPGQERVLVALGDSYMSGEGAHIYYTEKVVNKDGTAGPVNEDNHCNRAPTAWAAMAGQTERLFDSVAFLACSGARTYNVNHENLDNGTKSTKSQSGEPGTQLDQADALKTEMGADFVPSLVVISLGGNDAGFSTIGAMCLAPGNCSDERDLWERNLPKVGRALGNTFAQVRAEFPESPVVAVPYPLPVYTDEDGNAVTCDQVALSKEDMGFIAEFLPQLNETVRKAAESERFYFLADMENSLKAAHLQLCDPENDNRPGINFIGLRSVGGVAEQRFNPKNWYHNSLHPNERGHAAMLQVFENWRVRNPRPDVDNPDADPTANNYTDAVSSTTLPPCDLIDDDQSTSIKCRTAGTDWAKGQVADSLLRDWWGLQFAIAVLAAWLLALALFSWWKPWWTPRPAALGGSCP